MTRLLAMMAGFWAWAAQFTLVYGATSVLCFRGLADIRVLGVGLVQATIVATTIAALAVAAFVLVRAFAARPQLAGHPADDADRFLNTSTILVSALALVAIAYTGIPALILPACG